MGSTPRQSRSHGNELRRRSVALESSTHLTLGDKDVTLNTVLEQTTCPNRSAALRTLGIPERQAFTEKPNFMETFVSMKLEQVTLQ